MKPLKLKFKGINSFSEQTEIDFEKLTRSGFFGIFGDTGSGKSTILDCISFALYGRVERSREKLDIINYRSDSAEVQFEFDVLCEGERKRYTVIRSLKKKSGLHKAMLYEGETCVADNASGVTKKITDILGVDADDFGKCIALPQGEFSQFVKSPPKDRIELIERLFSLSKYGERLKERIKARESETELEYSALSARLSTYADVSEEYIKGLAARLEESRKTADDLAVKLGGAEKRFQTLKALGEKRAELDETTDKLNSATVLKDRMETVRLSLKALPICRSAVETDGEIAEKKKNLPLYSQKLSAIETRLSEEKNKLTVNGKKLEEGKFEEEIARRSALLTIYSNCTGKAERLKKLERELAAKREEYKSGEARLKELRAVERAAENAVQAAEQALAQCGSGNLDFLINVRYKGAVLKEEYVNALDYFVGLNGEVRDLKDKSALYEFLSRELKQQIETFKDKVYQVKDFSLAEAQMQIKDFKKSEEEKNRLTDQLNEKRSALKDARTAADNCLRELSVIKRDGENLREQYDETKSELSRVFGNDCSDYASAESENRRSLSELKAEKAKLENAVRESTEKISSLNAEKAAASAAQAALKAETDALGEKLKNLIAQSGYGDLSGCRKLVEELKSFPDAASALEEYDRKIILLTERKAQLETVEGIKSFSRAELLKAEAEKDGAAVGLSAEREKIAVIKAEYDRATVRLIEKSSIEKSFGLCEKQRGLIARLKELTRSNRFMEYIANEYLYDISSLASSTLIKLTDGRYFLTYTDTFYVGDNFNSGNLRGVNTLSGGETFLVSLSLALALSQTICAKSMKSIEFFFLDEGFGTLDSALVDTVMNALEKLKSSSFTIGVISHVEELKHRIDSKITVIKATESHGSTVQLNC